MATFTTTQKSGQPTTDQYLNIGEGYNLLIGDGFKLLIQADGPGTVWAVETKN